MKGKVSKRVRALIVMLAVLVFMTGANTVTVNATVKVKSGKTMTVAVGQSKTIKAKGTKSGRLTYSSSSKAIATVSSKGVVKGKKPGTCKITIKQKSSKATVKVTVRPANVKLVSVTPVDPGNALKVVWQKAAGASGYYVYYSVDGSTYKKKVVSGSKTTSVVLNNLEYSKAYYVRIKAYGGKNKWVSGSYSARKKVSTLAEPKSAMEALAENGYTGTEQAWNDALAGKGLKPGQTAYDMAVENGYKGTMQEWLKLVVDSKDKNGVTAYDIAVANGYEGTKAEWLTSITGVDRTGAEDIDWNNVQSAYVDDNENLILVLNDGTEINAGKVGSITAPDVETFTVTFYDYDGRQIDVQTVVKGNAAKAPESPKRSGYLFVGWSKDFSNVQEDMSVVAVYEDASVSAISVSDVTTKRGDKEVKVEVSVKNPGILGMILKLDYNEGAMTLKSAANGDAVSDVLTLTKPGEMKSGCNFVWDGIELKDYEIRDGVILTLTFDILDNATEGQYPISISYSDGDIIDGNLLPIDLTIKSGMLNIEK